MSTETDAVIAYVDCSDQKWSEQLYHYAEIENEHLKMQRFRSYGTLGLLTKCIRKFMPFIDRIYIIVQQESQIPEDLKDSQDVTFVFHKDIIPNDKLPVFNSQAIEPFMHKIPNLKEHFIYFNDDMFPIKPLQYSDFYTEDDRPKWRMKHWRLTDVRNSFRHVCLHSYIMAAKKAVGDGNVNMNNILVPEHGIAPMFKSDCEEIFECYKEEILNGITRFRKPWNVNQYLYSVYSAMKRGYGVMTKRFTYRKMADMCEIDSETAFKKLGQSMLCINDVHTTDEQFDIGKTNLMKLLEYLVGS